MLVLAVAWLLIAPTLGIFNTPLWGDAGTEAGWWRLPFLLKIPLGLTALWIRTRLTEAAVYTEASAHKETTKSLLRHVLANNWRQMLILAGFVVLLNVAFYLILGYMPTYLSGQLGAQHRAGQLDAGGRDGPDAGGYSSGRRAVRSDWPQATVAHGCHRLHRALRSRDCDAGHG